MSSKKSQRSKLEALRTQGGVFAGAADVYLLRARLYDDYADGRTLAKRAERYFRKLAEKNRKATPLLRQVLLVAA